MRYVLVELASRRYAVPHECPCCGGAPQTELRVKRNERARPAIATSARYVDLPYCRRCVEHVRSYEAAGVYTAGLLLLGIIASVVTGIVAGIGPALVPLLLALVVAFWLGTRRRRAAQLACGPSCASPETALTYLGWDGTSTGFMFHSPTYAARVAEANLDILAQPTPALRQLLEHHRAARLAVPTPAAAIDLSAAPFTVGDWIGKITSASGPAQRRTVVVRALSAITDEPQRSELVTAAARAHLADFLGKFTRTASRETQAKMLADEIAQVTADNLPAPVQEAALRDLEARQRQL